VVYVVWMGWIHVIILDAIVLMNGWCFLSLWTILSIMFWWLKISCRCTWIFLLLECFS